MGVDWGVMMADSTFYLKVQQVEKVCSFELSWGQSQQIGVTLAYPDDLQFKYHEWQRIYLRFYGTALRGRVAEVGTLVASPIDWHSQLIQAEAQLLAAFNHWLRSAELYEIRSTIAKATTNTENPYLDIFLTCHPLDLARLPWEVWELSGEFASSSTSKVRIVRTALNRKETVNNGRRNGKAKILIILGDETGLNFQAEKQALAALGSLVQPQFIGWQPGKSIAELKSEIVREIKAESGWDILLFLGHSNETSLTGGEIAIAPNTALSISEIEQALITAKSRGLQFAIFNSCQGLTIANKLIDLGLSQVAVMREPIHNSVARDFLIKFIQALANYQDVHQALTTATQYLQLEKHLTYPSAYLIPSLFRYPTADLFRLQPHGFRQIIQNFKPSRKEAIALTIILLISLLLPVQNFLLQRRLLVQAIYRQLTNQVGKATPPVLLVEVDEESIRKAKISNPKPLDRKYLASLVDRLAAHQARVVGIDYLLDRPQEQSDRILAKSIQAAVSAPKPTWFVFAATSNRKGDWLQTLPNIASLNWSLQGEIEFLPGYMQIFPINDLQSDPWYFSSLLTLAHQLQQIPNSPQPKLDSQTDLLQQINVFLQAGNKSHQTILSSPRSHLQPITALSYWLNQMWMHPIVDFSLPPNQIYQTIPAWKLQENQGIPQTLPQQIVIIVPGGYDEAGINNDGEDILQNSDLPLAVEYWRYQQNSLNKNRVLTGGEYHAYMVHHLSTKRLAIPIPDFWIIAIAIVLGKSLYILQQKRQYHSWQIFIISTTITGLYGIVSLQLYVSGFAVLFPWFLPSATLWFYILPMVYKGKSYA